MFTHCRYTTAISVESQVTQLLLPTTMRNAIASQDLTYRCLSAYYMQCKLVQKQIW